MKSWLKFVCALFVFCSLPAAGFAASGSPTGPTRPEGTQMAAPLAEMMFYEAAEQAVEDSYATIIPDSEDKTTDDTAKPEEKKTAPASDTPDVDAVKQNQ